MTRIRFVLSSHIRGCTCGSRKLHGWGATGVALAIVLAVTPFTQAQTDRGAVELSVQHQIMDLVRQGFEAAKNRDSGTVQKILTEDALDVGEYGIWDAKHSAQSIASLEKHPDSSLSEYSLSDWNFRKPCQDVVVVAYKATLIGISHNVRQKPIIQYFSAVWVRKGETWRNLLYHDSTAPEASTSNGRSNKYPSAK